MDGKLKKWIIMIFTTVAIVLAVVYNFGFEIAGHTMLLQEYLYLLFVLFLPFVFLLRPLTFRGKRNRLTNSIDIVLSILSFCIPFYFCFHAQQMLDMGWEFLPPKSAVILGTILWVIFLETSRRSGGIILMIAGGILSLFPLFSSHMPDLLIGAQFPFRQVVGLHFMGSESVLGIPARVFGKVVIGYLFFGTALLSTGGGTFFINLATALLGRFRGGAAKVSVVSSGLFGSISGSALANVLSTGIITIPAMKKGGYDPNMAAATEACASTGGVLLPPVMGATAFVMADFLRVSYVEIALAAFIPIILYYLAVFIGVDSYAAHAGLKGLDKNELPLLKTTLREGWFYIAAGIVLVHFLFIARLSTEAPYYAAIALLILCNTREKTRLTWSRIQEFLSGSARVLSDLLAIMGVVGFIVGSLAMTGVAHGFTREILALAGENVPLLLFLGLIVSIFLGMGLTITAVYIFVALLLAPALIQSGFEPISAHFFILYAANLSNITPPVCIPAFAAAKLAKGDPMRAGFTAMRLGLVLFLLPFVFVYSPSLLLQGGSVIKTIWVIIQCLTGSSLVAAGLWGYLPGIGRFGRIYQLPVGLSGILFLVPSNSVTVMGLAIAAACIITKLVVRFVRPNSAIS